MEDSNAAPDPGFADLTSVPDEEIEAFWRRAANGLRLNLAAGYFGPSPLEVLRPPAWSLADDEAEADARLASLVAGDITAIATRASDYNDAESPRPVLGDLDIVLDGRGSPQAVLATGEVTETAAGEVTGDVLALVEGVLAPDDLLVLQQVKVVYTQH